MYSTKRGISHVLIFEFNAVAVSPITINRKYFSCHVMQDKQGLNNLIGGNDAFTAGMGGVWEEFCLSNEVPDELQLLDVVKHYEAIVLCKLK